MLRHSAGYALSNRGVSTRDLQAFMGHRNISNTVIYTAVADKRLRTIWRYAKDPDVEVGLQEFIADAENRLEQLQNRRFRPLDIDEPP